MGRGRDSGFLFGSHFLKISSSYNSEFNTFLHCFYYLNCFKIVSKIILIPFLDASDFSIDS